MTGHLPTCVLDSDRVDWVEAGSGLSFKPLAFLPDNGGWVQLLRLEPGTVIPRHRHTGEVHALNLSGQRVILDDDRLVGPLTYVHESPGDVDSWMAVGGEPCIVYVEVHGTVEYLGPGDEVEVVVDADLQRQLYLESCWRHGGDVVPELASDAAVE